MGDVILFVPRSNPDRFARGHEMVRHELASLVPFAKSGEPPSHPHGTAIHESSLGYVYEDNACSEINPDCA